MANPKEVLVVTSSNADGLKIRRFIKPVSAHIVAGTNMFSDFLGSLSDVFGGRSQTYQKQLSSLYNEAIERIKHAAHELGADCVIGLNIDIDEISGKGKSMFMITAIGTAVVLEKQGSNLMPTTQSDERFENIGVDRLNTLQRRRTIIAQAEDGNLSLNEDVWDFITSNQVHEVLPSLLRKFERTIVNEQLNQGSTEKFYRLLSSYLDAMPEDRKIELLYDNVRDSKVDSVITKLSQLIKDLQLLDYDKVKALIANDDFKVQKRGLAIVTYDKPFYNKQDVINLNALRTLVKNTFVEKGKRSMKKQLLSSKEKEIWNCDCGKTNDIGFHCTGCQQDIYGFKEMEVKPDFVDLHLQEKVELINEYIK
ncbi:YbjQ family protein [Pedobacter sp. GSP4]|uniref:YbjQ family protein n=1 Tax=Pedobacter sp. GSP4 TaxID=3453716 RepID=UPI003EEF28A5